MDLQVSVFLLFILFTAVNNSTTIAAKSCALPIGCPSGSINFGIGKIASSCCNTDLCNAQNAPDASVVPNGKTCYYCDGQSCSNTLSCSGSEDRCIKATANLGGQSIVVKGCISKSVCDAVSILDSFVGGVSCCEGNMCNNAISVTQSFLFLCGSLLSFILLH
ncbi:urokinase plasminogen activator surface receptor-like [Garra rufa]|uniref:urokinase plasminogen activator surface receptor-like n=1 Tax=Garra rufa TaxID=137080 RepID=UPI003CCE9980